MECTIVLGLSVIGTAVVFFLLGTALILLVLMIIPKTREFLLECWNILGPSETTFATAPEKDESPPVQSIPEPVVAPKNGTALRPEEIVLQTLNDFRTKDDKIVKQKIKEISTSKKIKVECFFEKPTETIEINGKKVIRIYSGMVQQNFRVYYELPDGWILN